MHTSENTTGNHRRREAGALFVSPVHDYDRVPGANIQIIQHANDLKPGQHPEHTVVLATGRLCIEVAANIDWQRIRIRTLTAREHGAHLIEPHAATGRLTPLLKQHPPFGVIIGECLAVVTTGDSRADFCHFHQ